MKHSKQQRKFVNQMRAMGDVPWPARRFKYPPTLGRLNRKTFVVGVCQRKIGETKTRKRKLSRKKQTPVLCGGPLIAKLGSLGKRRVYCESCRQRKAQQRIVRRLEQRMTKMGALSPREQIREERRSVKMLQRFRRKGAR